MSIIVSCICGKRFKAKDEYAGMRTKCPSCGQVLVIGEESDNRAQNQIRDEILREASHKKNQNKTSTRQAELAEEQNPFQFFPGLEKKSPELAGCLSTIALLLVVTVGGALFMTLRDSGQQKNMVEFLPKNAVYSDPEGSGGSYTDKMNGFFSVEPLVGFRIEERHKKARITIYPHGSRKGKVVSRSWVQFKRKKVQIGVIARETFETDIDENFEIATNNLEKAGAKILFHRYITIDGVDGGECVYTFKGVGAHLVKYIKYGVDHAITCTWTGKGKNKYQERFLDFLRSYRSIRKGHNIR